MRFLFVFTALSLFAQAPFADNAADPIVATVEGRPVRASDVRHMLESSPPEFATLFKERPQSAIQQYYMVKYLAAEGEKLGLADKEPLKEELATMRARAVAGAMVNNERDGFNVTLDLIKNFYEQNKSHYEQAKIRIIFLRFRPDAVRPGMTPEEAAKIELERQNSLTQRTEAETKKIADDVARQLKAGAKFEAMAAKYSEHEDSKKQGGLFDMPITEQSPYPEDLKKTVLALKTGEVSAPLRQSNGYYFFQVVEKSTRPMDEVIEPIIQEIRQAHLSDFLTNLNQRFTPVVKKPEFFVKPEEFFKK